MILPRSTSTHHRAHVARIPTHRTERLVDAVPLHRQLPWLPPLPVHQRKTVANTNGRQQHCTSVEGWIVYIR